MKPGWGAAFALIGGLLGVGLLWLLTSPPRGQPVALQPLPTPAPWVVHVVGAVAQPGVYRLPPRSRVEDALAAAGGLLPDSDAASLNLAALLTDGAQVAVARLAPVAAAPAGSPAPAGSSAPAVGSAPAVALSSQGSIAAAAPGTLVNINTAAQGELEALPEIGPATAQKIIAYRQEHGPFRTIEQIQDVKGIGPATFAEIKGLITVGEPPVPLSGPAP